MATITVDEANRVENTTALRVKFASMDEKGNTWPDAGEEYVDFFSDLPAGWSVEPIGMIQTRTEYLRQAWQLSDGQNEFVAVEHETGLELLVVPVLTNVVAAGLIALVGWGWQRWNGRRASGPHKKDVSLVIEVPRVGSVTAPPIRLVIPPPVSDDDIAKYLRLAQQEDLGG